MEAKEIEALGRRAMACKGWRWLPGMRVNEEVVIEVDGCIPCVAGGTSGYSAAVHGGVPDLSDPATLGCCLSLLREASGRPGLFIAFDLCDGLGWYDSTSGERWLATGRYSTEAEALVAAWEAV